MCDISEVVYGANVGSVMENTQPIRTYRPHKLGQTQLQIISNAPERCRLCLAYSKKLQPIFDKCNVSLATRIFACLSIQVVENKHLPSHICEECRYELDRFYEFRKKCNSNDQKLKGHLRIAELQPPACKAKCLTSESLEKSLVKELPRVLHMDIKRENNSAAQVADALASQRIEKSWRNSELCDPKAECAQRVGALVRAELLQGRQRAVASRAFQLVTSDGAVITLHLDEETCEKTEQPVVVYLPTTVAPLASNLPPAQRLSCQQCDKTFMSTSSLQRHGLVHTGERPWLCPTCGQRFAQKVVLRRHQLVHLEKRPFACDECEKSFTQRGALRAHAASHLPPARRPLRLRTCPFCPKIFCHSSGLSRHLLVHNGRQFACRHCSRLFADKSSLRRHVRARHEPPPPHQPPEPKGSP